MAYTELIAFIKRLYGDSEPIPLYRSYATHLASERINACLEAGVVSSVGPAVTELESRVAEFVGARHGVAVVNGTNALQIALQLLGVQRDEEVITQALTFVATANAISYVGAQPVFVDVDRDTLGLSSDALARFLEQQVERREDGCYNRVTQRRIAACLPMHTFGLPARIDAIASLCADWGIPLLEDAAEALGSRYRDHHVGTLGQLGVFSFNGNKVLTTGGGGMIVTDDDALAQRARHLTTTAKVPHPYEYVHDELGYNLRMPNLNAALGCAQMDLLPQVLAAKRALAAQYAEFCAAQGLVMVQEPEGACANHWLNAILLDSPAARDDFLRCTHAAGILTRPIWRLMSDLPMYADCQHDGLAVSRHLAERVVNLPSYVPEDTGVGSLTNS